MMVVFGHIRNAFGWSFIPNSFLYGYGVTFFFILSGFILTHNYLHKPIPFGHFIQNRWARLWPAHMLWLAALLLLVPSGWWNYDGHGLLNQWVILPVNIFMLHSFVPVQEYFFSWNNVSWSISTEFFLYLVFLFLLKNIHKTWYYKLSFTFMLFCSLKIVQFYRIFDGINVGCTIDVAYTFPPARVFEFFVGMCAYLLWERIRSRDITLIFLPASGVLMYFAWRFSSFQHSHLAAILNYTFVVAALASLIISVAKNEGIVGYLLGNRLFVYLGEISYSCYLCHQVIIRMFIWHGYAGYANHYWTSLSPAWQAIFYFLTIFAASALSYHVVENPGRKLLRMLDFQKTVHSFLEKGRLHIIKSSLFDAKKVEADKRSCSKVRL